MSANTMVNTTWDDETPEQTFVWPKSTSEHTEVSSDTLIQSEDELKRAAVHELFAAEDAVKHAEGLFEQARHNLNIAEQRLKTAEQSLPDLIHRERKPKHTAYKRLDPAKSASLLAAFDKGHTISAIAEHYDITQAAVRNRIRRSGREL